MQTENVFLLPDSSTSSSALTKSYLLFTKIYIGFIAFTHGIAGIAAVPLFMHSRNELKKKLHTIKSVQIFVDFPWTVKPLVGIFIDNVMCKLKRTKFFIGFVSLLRSSIYLFLYSFKLPDFLFYPCLLFNSLCYILESILCEYILNITAKKEEETSTTGKKPLPLYLGCKAIGSIMGALVGYKIINHISQDFPLLICSLTSFLVVLASIVYPEAPQKLSPKLPLNIELREVVRTARTKKISINLFLLCLFRLQPAFGGLYSSFYTEKLLFTSKDMAYFAVVNTCFYIAALIVYRIYLEKIKPRKVFYATLFLALCLNVLFLLFLLGWIEGLPVSPLVFCFVYQALETFVSNLNYLPLYTIWSKSFPNNMEATSLTILSCLVNFASSGGAYVGVLFERFLKLNKKDFSGLWKAAAIQSVYVLILLVVSLIVLSPKCNEPAEPLDIEIGTL